MIRTVRVTCTLPADVLRDADRLAKRLDRSRSWVVAEALRRLTGQQPGADATPAVREPAPVPYELQQAFRAAELSRLESDLALTPEQRVREAEETLETALRFHRPPRFDQVLMFGTLEDYFAWKKRDLLS